MIASYYDGKTSQRRQVTLHFDGDALSLSGDEVSASYPRSALVIEPRIGRLERTVRLPDGGMLLMADNEEFARVFGSSRSGFFTLVHRFETSIKLALMALLVTAVIVIAFIRFGLPALANRVAFAIPLQTEKMLGEETLENLDKFLLKPSKLSSAQKRHLRTLFAAMVHEYKDGRTYRLELRSSKPIGANAFALPSGIIIVTDDMVKLAHNDEELIGVLAHEISHVQHRHIMRHILQNSATGLIIAVITGDVTSITSLAATLPTAVVNATYSRQFEREADDGAVAYLRGHRIPVRRYADILGRLEKEHGRKEKEKEKEEKEKKKWHSLLELLSSHPDTNERIRRVLEQRGGEK